MQAVTQSRFVAVVLDSNPSAALLTVYLLVVLESMHEARCGPLMGIVSDQKAPQGSETETREFREERRL